MRRLVGFEGQAEMTSKGLAIRQDGEAFLGGRCRKNSMEDEPKAERTMGEVLAAIRTTFAVDDSEAESAETEDRKTGNLDYGAGLKMNRPGGACLQTGPSESPVASS